MKKCNKNFCIKKSKIVEKKTKMLTKNKKIKL